MQMYLQRYSTQPDPSWATVWFTPEQVGVWNWERWDSAEFKALHEEGLVEGDVGKRNEIYTNMQNLMDESGCYVFLTHEVVGVLHKDTISPGLKPNGDVLYPEFKSA